MSLKRERQKGGGVVEGGMVRVRRKGREVKGGGVEGALHAYD